MMENILVAAVLAIIFIICMINNYLKNKVIKGYMHSLNICETEKARQQQTIKKLEYKVKDLDKFIRSNKCFSCGTVCDCTYNDW